MTGQVGIVYDVPALVEQFQTIIDYHKSIAGQHAQHQRDFLVAANEGIAGHYKRELDVLTSQFGDAAQIIVPAVLDGMDNTPLSNDPRNTLRRFAATGKVKVVSQEQGLSNQR